MLETFLKEMTLIMLQIHASLKRLNVSFQFNLTDKQLHFVIMAFLGMALFFIVNAVFRKLAKLSVTAISFIYVFTVMGAFGIAVEIGQHLLASGKMDMADVMAGQGGVLLFFGIYTAYKLTVALVSWVIRCVKKKKTENAAE